MMSFSASFAPCVCGSDLWSYRNPDIEEGHQNSGHEAIGIVEEIGEAITTVKPGDFVIALSPMGVGSVMPVVLAMMEPVTAILGPIGLTGVQAEYMRFEYANWALVKVPGQPSDYTEAMLKSFLTLADVMPTGYHAACGSCKTGRQSGRYRRWGCWPMCCHCS